MIGIYKITNPKGQSYIGKSVSIQRRFLQHKSNKGSVNKYLKESFEKYGIDNHNFEILEECELEDLKEREIYYQSKYLSVYKGLNCNMSKDEFEKTIDAMYDQVNTINEMIISRVHGRILFNGKQFHELDYDETIQANELLMQMDNHLSMSDLVDMVKKKARLLGDKVTLVFEKI